MAKRGHLTWTEQIARGIENGGPCRCWHDGYAYKLSAKVVQHPTEWEEGAQARYERDHDI